MSKGVKLILGIVAIVVGFVFIITNRHEPVSTLNDWLHFLASVLFGFGVGLLFSFWRKQE
ncbi:MAG: hypothetical protein RR212_13200 [Bacteroidales bacterium]